MWNGRRYYSLDCYLKEQFGEKLYKLTLDGGMTCPNRDGTKGTGGCIFCSGMGSGDFAEPCLADTGQQIAAAKAAVAAKFDGSRYIAYFQSFTNTYAQPKRLRELFMPVIMRDDIAILDIATRPDCLPPEVLSLISELSQIKPVWVELGLQSSNDKTAQLINRCYPTSVYDEAVKQLHEAGATVITHMIIGLPGEDRVSALNTAHHISRLGSDGIKLQLLHVLGGTFLADMYARGEFRTLDEDEYIDIVTDIIAMLPPEMVIHRLTGDGSRKELIAPRWSLDKRQVLNGINKRLKEKGIIQGCNKCEK